MKRLTGILLGSLLLTACNNEGDSAERKLDSLETRIDTTAEKVWDSTKAKAKDLKERIEQKIENRDADERSDSL
jgi:RNase adaptor protein for sRNA GlmZ degradation